MVMTNYIMRKNLVQSIIKSLGRYIAIVLIIALGAGMFVGLRTTKSDMISTCQMYTDQQNMFDLRLISTYGWTQNQVMAISEMEGIQDAEGIFSVDAVFHRDNAEDESVYRIYTLPEKVNLPFLVSGRFPASADECVVDARKLSDKYIGTKLVLSESNDSDIMDTLSESVFTIVGRVNSPLYMNMDRGTTSVGNGSISAFMYVPLDGVKSDYFTEIDVRITGSHIVYSDDYDNAMDRVADGIKPMLTPLAQDRYEFVRNEAEDAYAEGLQKLVDGKKEYDENWENAQKEFLDAQKALQDAQKEIADNEAIILDGEKQILEGQKTLDDGRKELLYSRNILSKNKEEIYDQIATANSELLANYRTVLTNLRQIEDGILQIDNGLVEINSGISQLEAGLSQLDTGLSQLDILISVMDVSISTAQAMLDEATARIEEDRLNQLQQRLDNLIASKEEYVAKRNDLSASRDTYSAQLSDLRIQKESLESQKNELLSNRDLLNNALDTINIGFMESQNGKAQADLEFGLAEDQIAAAQLQLENGQAELDAKKKELEEGKIELDKAKQTLQDGQDEYDRSYEDAMNEFAAAKKELDDAENELADARDKIDNMSEPSTFVLTRNTNVGYVTFESNADIVAGVSKVFPVFFLLVAAMVCITTMTRMVDEERTQIGTLKALGYTNREIASKYLIYAGSAAIIGCGVGVVAGSIVFPTVLWQAYCIILNVTDWVVLGFDWTLCVLVLLAYTSITLIVTWHSCRTELRDVPAELIRPKPPTAGKKILFERFSFWNRISFLNKVAIRNIFRYRQRLFMMLLGIGGCTALLVTGFGIRDSIVDIVDIQFENVTKYDISITFADDQTDELQDSFRSEVKQDIQGVLFCHQSNVELDFSNRTKEINLLAPNGSLEGFMDLHYNNQSVEMPHEGEAIISVGAAKDLGIAVGDFVTVRNPDMQVMELRINGIFDNNVYNYLIVSPQTIEDQWGSFPKLQTAYVNVLESQEPHEVGAYLTGLQGVLNVTVNKDMAKSVGSMMEAMDLVVLTVVFCAALLAVIVLYNLTNINITERVREIATIKVLGFNAVETGAYVFKENLVLSAMGAIIGLGFGKLLHSFVMSQIKIDMVWFQNRITFASYLLSVVLTMLSACVVALIFYFRLDKINMAEALKSIE